MPVQVDLNEKKDVYEATFANLGINKVVVPSEPVKQLQKLLVSAATCFRRGWRRPETAPTHAE